MLDVDAPPPVPEVAPPGFESLDLPRASTVRAGLAQLVAGGGDGVDTPAVAPVVAPVVAIDLETSGLGGQTIAFIVALAWHCDDGHVALAQWTLRDARGERSMLLDIVSTLRGAVGPGTHLLSFNGRSFDVPRLRARLRRLGVAFGDLLDAPHVDLLHPARRLWKGRARDCRLATLEALILGVRRRGDVDGEEIAGLWDAMQRRGADDDPYVVSTLDAAQRHNRADVLGLLALTAAAAERLAAPTDADEALRAARHFVAHGRPDEALARLHAPVADAIARPPHRDDARDAVMLAAELHRRRGAYEDAARLWSWVCAHAPGDPEAHEALAKHLEHRRRDPASALRIAARSSAPSARRLARLRRKVGDTGSAPEV